MPLANLRLATVRLAAVRLAERRLAERRRTVFRRVALLGLFVVTWLAASSAGATDEPAEAPNAQQQSAAPELWLYTVGAGTPTFERFGHTMLCETGEPKSRCWDFGRWDEADTAKMVRASLDGQPAFGVTQVELEPTLDALVVQDRRVDKQRIPLDAPSHARLLGELERRVDGNYRYAYHPLTRNCSTEIRDLLDEATHGKLRETARTLRTDGKTYRQLAREGLSGKVLELALVTLLVGRADDRVPDAFERAFLPDQLAAITERALAAPRVPVLTERLPALPQSAHAGDIVLALLSLLLAGWLACARSERARVAAFGVMGVSVAAIGCLRLVGPLFTTYPELALGLEVLFVPPTDLALPWLPEHTRRTYLRLRCATCVGAPLVSHLAVPPLIPLGFVCISLLPPLGALLGAERRARRKAQG